MRIKRALISVRRARGKSGRTFDCDEPEGDPPDRSGQCSSLRYERRLNRDSPASKQDSAYQDPSDDVEDAEIRAFERKDRNASRRSIT